MSHVIIIDPETRTIETRDVPEGDYLSFLQSIVGGFLEVAVTFPARSGWHETLYVDEEAVLKGVRHGFLWDSYPVFGKGIIVRERDGDDVLYKPMLTVDDVRRAVRFASLGTVINAGMETVE